VTYGFDVEEFFGYKVGVLSYSGDIPLLPLDYINSLKNRSKCYDEIVSGIDDFKNQITNLQEQVSMLKQDNKNEANRHNAILNDLVLVLERDALQLGTKKGSGDLGRAMMVADSIRGLSTKEILAKEYPYKKNFKQKKDVKETQHINAKNPRYFYKTYSKTRVYEALAIIDKDSNTTKLDSMMQEFPDVFEGITEDMVSNWVAKRRSAVKSTNKS
jgi:hypothetical protein